MKTGVCCPCATYLLIYRLPSRPSCPSLIRPPSPVQLRRAAPAGRWVRRIRAARRAAGPGEAGVWWVWLGPVGARRGGPGGVAPVSRDATAAVLAGNRKRAPASDSVSGDSATGRARNVTETGACKFGSGDDRVTVTGTLATAATRAWREALRLAAPLAGGPGGSVAITMMTVVDSTVENKLWPAAACYLTGRLKFLFSSHCCLRNLKNRRLDSASPVLSWQPGPARAEPDSE